MKTKLIAIGSTYVDINTAHFPFYEDGLLPETEFVGSSYETTLGGSAVNFARLCVAQEIDTAFVGKRGADRLGDIMHVLFDESGIEAHLIKDENTQTNISFNMINESEKSIMAVVGSANQSLTAFEILPVVEKLLPGCSHVFMGGCFKQPQLIPAYNTITERARKTGVITVLDHGRLRPELTDVQKEAVRNLAKNVTYYLPSREEFLGLWGVSSIESGLMKFTDKTGPKVVVKDGARGAWVLDGGLPTLVPGFKTKPLHTIGAGDSFDAGFIAAQSRGQNVVDSARYGCAAAALKISQERLPTKEQVEAKLIA